MKETMLEFWVREVGDIVADYFKFATLAFVIFYVLLKKPLWFRKIQKKIPKLTDYGRDILYSLVSVTIFASMALLVFYVLKDYTKTYSDIDEYGWGYYIFTWVAMFLIHDCYFYWMHRAMHHPVLYKHIHKVHHQSRNPSPWTAYAFHPLEAVLEVCILPILGFAFPIHGPAIGWFFLIQIIYNVYGHLGFELLPKGFHKTWIGRYFSTSVAHNLHHEKFHGNYGLYFLFWDRLTGTIRKDYDETYERTTESSHSR